MKKQQRLLFSLLLVVLLIPLASNQVFSAESADLNYGHISFVDNSATVIRQDKTEHQAVVNLPVAPGDQIITGEKGRCEVQFDNGTIIRLDKDSRLKVETILAPSLTSRWKITTLQLMRGQLSSISQSYNREMFQIMTPNAAIELKRRSTAFIQLKDNGDTSIFSQRGKFPVMYGESIQTLKTETLRRGTLCTITAGHQMHLGEGKRDLDFVAWNDYINRNFRDLHYGISKVPKKIYRYSKGLVYWAEKWSSLFGEWVYDDLFGYVWKPADEIFAYSERPFFHADWVRINGKLFLVPQQLWGWVPAHMGTWVWTTNGGWTWIPGSAFYSGMMSSPFGYSSNLYYLTLGSWLNTCYGDYDLYLTYRYYGSSAWRKAYREKFNVVRKNPVSKEIPKSVREIIDRMNKAPVTLVKERLGNQFRAPVIEMEKVKPLLKSLQPADIMKKGEIPAIKARSGRIVTSTSIVGPVSDEIQVNKEPGELKMKGSGGGGGGSKVIRMGNFRDWNPDSRWAARRGYSIHYSPQKNAVICPNLGLSSQTITGMQRAFLRFSGFAFRGSQRGGNSSSGSAYSHNSITDSRSAASSGHRGGGGSHARTGGSAREK